MAERHDNPYAALNRLFHEPSRLAIVSLLAAAPDGLSFRELKAETELTDGNLSRHLKALKGDRIVRVRKRFVGVKPKTTAYLTDSGSERFLSYLQALELVLQKAADAVGPEHSAADAPASLPKAVKA